MSLVTKINEGFMRLAQLVKGKQDKLNFDTTPTQNSTNPVTSGGVFTALQSVGNPFAGFTVQSLTTNPRALNTNFVISSTKNALVTYSLQATLSGVAATGMTVSLVVDNAEISSVKVMKPAVNETQTLRAAVSGFVPAGKAVRILAGNMSGTTSSLYVGQEVLF
ncbi:hypothetical protein ACRZTK_001085 [Enterobacter asburiae]